MKCKHNDDPRKCSQCLQAKGQLQAPVKKVPMGVRTAGPEPGYGTVIITRAKRCHHCGKVGHKPADCRDHFNRQAEKALYN